MQQSCCVEYDVLARLKISSVTEDNLVPTLSTPVVT